jgi:hypothetical protein
VGEAAGARQAYQLNVKATSGSTTQSITLTLTVQSIEPGNMFL